MESKIPEWFLSFYESLFLAQLRALRQLKSPKLKKTKGREGKSISNMDMVIDILRWTQKPKAPSCLRNHCPGQNQARG